MFDCSILDLDPRNVMTYVSSGFVTSSSEFRPIFSRVGFFVPKNTKDKWAQNVGTNKCN